MRCSTKPWSGTGRMKGGMCAPTSWWGGVVICWMLPSLCCPCRRDRESPKALHPALRGDLAVGGGHLRPCLCRVPMIVHIPLPGHLGESALESGSTVRQPLRCVCQDSGDSITAERASDGQDGRRLKKSRGDTMAMPL